MAPPSQASGIRIGHILGIPIYLHTSWFIIFVLITLSLSTQFRSQHPTWTAQDHWLLGVITSLLFFGSVVFHELSHSLVAKHYGIRVESITLFVFGGLSKIARDPDNGRQEFNVAIAGPVASFFLAGVFWLLSKDLHGSEMMSAACFWLWRINAMLGLFNLIPGFPLDGGRVLRGIAWGATKDFGRATRIATASGKFFAYAMIVWGIVDALGGNWVSGIWLAFIGWFLLSAAQETYAQTTLRSTLSGMRAADIMSRDVPTVSRDITLDDYAHEVLRTGRRFHIVTAGDRPVGMITLHAVQSVPRDEWANTSVQAVMLPADKIHWVSPDEPALSAFERMQREDVSQMPVLSEGHLVGLIGRDSILKVLQAHVELSDLGGHHA